MITLIHGNNTEASRAHLTKLKSEARAKEIREVRGKVPDLTMFIQASESQSFFGKETLVILENACATLKKKQKARQALIQAILAAPRETDIILYEENEIDKGALELFGARVKVLRFKAPPVIFAFLDSLRPNHARGLLELLQKTSDEAELLFTLLVRRVRQLMMARDGTTPPGLADWQLSRLTGQARFFTMEKLLAMHKNLISIDISVKTGSSPFTLAQQLEQFVIDL